MMVVDRFSDASGLRRSRVTAQRNTQRAGRASPGFWYNRRHELVENHRADSVSLWRALRASWPTERAAKEARPPKWSRDVLDTFFDDAREKLVGPRPDYGADAESIGSAGERARVSNRPRTVDIRLVQAHHGRHARNRSQTPESIR